MGLSSVKAKTQKSARPDVVIDLSPLGGDMEGETIRFREPGPQSFFSPQAEKTRVKADYPQFNNEVVTNVLLLASCYVPEEGEKVDASLMLAEVAKNEPALFLYLLGKFSEAFPSAYDFGGMVEAAKKA